MTALANKETAHTIYRDIINGRQLDRAGECISTDYIEHEPFPGLENTGGLDTFSGWVRTMTAAFPDFAIDVQRMAADDDLVMAQITITGTHEGELLGIPATGRRVEVAGVDVGRFVDGKVVEHWGVTDQLSLLQQLGAVPEGESVAVATHRELHKAFNERRFDDITATMNEGHYVDHPRGLTMKSPDDFRHWLDDWVTGFPDAKVEDTTYFAAGNRSICVFTGRGTNTGPVGPLPPTGNRLDLKMCEHIICDDDGRPVGSEIYYDQMTLLVQLGHAEAPGS